MCNMGTNQEGYFCQVCRTIHIPDWMRFEEDDEPTYNEAIGLDDYDVVNDR